MSVTCVFVHLGNTSPNHLFLNLQRFIKIFPEIELVFIGDSAKNINRAKSYGIKTRFFDRTKNPLTRMPALSAGFNFRDGFWHYTLERIYAVVDWHSHNPAKKVLHVESDLLLTPDFPFEEFATLTGCAWPRVNHKTDMAGLLYIDNYKSSEKLVTELTQILNANPALNDMTALNLIAKQNVDWVKILPTWSETWASTGVSQEYVSLTAHFGGIFDAASLGTWILGQDPRNHWGIVRRFDVFSDYILNFTNFKFHVDDRGSFFADYEGQLSKVFTLHVHSKELKYFKINQWEQSIRKATMRNEKSLFRNSFVLGGFYYVVKGYAKVLFSSRGPRVVLKRIFKL